MATIDAHPANVAEGLAQLVERAAAIGYVLESRVTDTGQQVWVWCREHEPGPQFVTPRVAFQWMSELLAGHKRGC